MMNVFISSMFFSAAVLFSCSGLADYVEAEVVNGGNIKGNVGIGGAEPLTEAKSIFKNTEICGVGPRETPLVRSSGDSLNDVVVFLENVERGKPFPAANKKITINQKGCYFIPYLSVLANGGELEIVNSDPVLHNIHAYEMIGRLRNTLLTVSQPRRGNILTETIDLQRSNAIEVRCDAHDFMRAFVFVARNPYFATVDSNGDFEIKDVPPGQYTIKTWHGLLGIKDQSVEVSRGGFAIVNFSY